MVYATPTLRVWTMMLLTLSLACGQGSAGPVGKGGGMGGSEEEGSGGAPATGGRGGSPASGGSTGSGGAKATGGSGPGGSGGSTASGGSTGTGGSTVPPDGGSDPMMPPTMPPPTSDQPLPPCGRKVPVAGAGALGGALGEAMPGDCLELADGEYTFPAITAKGTAERPVVIRAANLLKVVVASGDVSITGGAYVVVEGFHFRSPGQIKMTDCDHCRVSRFRVERAMAGGEVDWITVGGTSKYCRIDHNDIGPQRQIGNMIMLSGAGAQTVQYTRIDHNHFHDVWDPLESTCRHASLSIL